MPGRILCVAEKPSIAKAVANHLGGGRVTTNHVQGNQYVKNYVFDFDFGPPWGACTVNMTSVLGHLTAQDFHPDFKLWAHPRPDSLFSAQINTFVNNDMKAVAKNIETQARSARALFIWTDCDREGEHIGSEVRDHALKGNRQIQVKRAKFSNIERAHVIQAARRPVDLDERQVEAVKARIEMDLRIGAAFTRFQTMKLQAMGAPFEKKVISYGSCQFPTLGFVVDRYWKVKNFIPEPFWSIKVMHRREDVDVNFSWRRNRLFDRASVIVLFERCLAAKIAKVVKVQEKPTKKWKPLPLTTLELQKMATRFLNMNSQRAMAVAEKLYQQGFISYPRTETDRFDAGMNLRALVEKQVQDPRWGTFAQGLQNGGFQQPRQGQHDDKAHPPIHPITGAAPTALVDNDERRLYEFVTRRFLACCSQDAEGRATDVEIDYGDEHFHAHGLVVIARNYLEVYPYENWNSSQPMPQFVLGETFEPTTANMTDGKTTAPGYLTEPDLLALMDANGIGTDATMAEHIARIKEREYVTARPRAGGTVSRDVSNNAPARGRGRGPGGRGGRGGSGSSASATDTGSRGGVQEFIPTVLGMALIEGYDNVGLDVSLSKPFLRKEMELRMKDICDGRKTKQEVVTASITQYKQAYLKTEAEIEALRTACRKYIPGLR